MFSDGKARVTTVEASLLLYRVVQVLLALTCTTCLPLLKPLAGSSYGAILSWITTMQTSSFYGSELPGYLGSQSRTRGVLSASAVLFFALRLHTHAWKPVWQRLAPCGTGQRYENFKLAMPARASCFREVCMRRCGIILRVELAGIDAFGFSFRLVCLS